MYKIKDRLVYLVLLFLVLQTTAFAQYNVGNDDGFSVSCVGSVSEVPLPIELLFFDAKCNNGKVTINWTTATEINNDYFTIERTTDGTAFQVIGKVNGGGNCIQTINYSFIDAEPLKGISYYRLKQTDFDGNFKCFYLVAVTCNDNNNNSSVNIFPNPNKGEFIIDEVKQNAVLIIFNTIGEKITEQKITSKKTEIYLSNLPNGIYFVHISSEKESVIQKLSIYK